MQRSILIVCDMLLTGFDAPIEQVMYLDSPLKEHTLLQAIARVNRTADHKDYGLIIDYWGVSEALQEALAVFSPSDIKGAMEPKTDELPRLQTRHAVAMHFFNAVKDKGDLEQCVAVLEPEDVPTIHQREPPPLEGKSTYGATPSQMSGSCAAHVPPRTSRTMESLA